MRSKYEQLNQPFFKDGLLPVQISWADLTENYDSGETYRQTDGTFVILVDQTTNLDEVELEDTVAHETCHVATWGQEEDPHGPSFQACMAHIKEKK